MHHALEPLLCLRYFAFYIHAIVDELIVGSTSNSNWTASLCQCIPGSGRGPVNGNCISVYKLSSSLDCSHGFPAGRHYVLLLR